MTLRCFRTMGEETATPVLVRLAFMNPLFRIEQPNLFGSSGGEAPFLADEVDGLKLLALVGSHA